MGAPSARVVLDSISEAGCRLTTIEVTMHRFVLAEFNTHRVFSRNSASSRAIPVKKQIERVLSDPALPISWPTEQSGMQGGEELMPSEREDMQRIWLGARDDAVRRVLRMTTEVSASNRPLHKSVANRLLEPFMWHTVIVSSTEWDNFWGLRCNPMAQPEMRAAAEAMKAAHDASSPVDVSPGRWHTPYLFETADEDNREFNELAGYDPRCISAARCARVSYLTHDGRRDPAKDIELYDRLISADPPHASPLEHVATPCPLWASEISEQAVGHKHLGNFTGWDQLRHDVIKEK